MTNQEKWFSYNEGLCSPNNYIAWGWRFIVAASLQRRVWYGESELPCYPNMYMVFYGPPGVGKGLVTNRVFDFLKYHKKKDVSQATAIKNDNEKMIIEKIDQANLEDAEASMIKLKRGGEKLDPPLFPYAPDATTYEALVESMAKAGRRINFTHINGEGESKLGIYYHCSMYFCLDELGSLFRKKADAVVNYLLGLYNCPLDYEYKTKTNGEDRVRRGCLNFLAGTTPDFMEEISDDKLIGKGFTARCFFICALKNRKNVARPNPLTLKQVQYKKDLLEHIKKLACLYGEAKPGPGVVEWVDEWWNNCENHRDQRPNHSPLLDVYYSRKNIHMYKVALAEHFGESTEMEIPLETFQRAARILDEEEKTMHLALMTESNNPLAKVTDKILEYISNRGKVQLVDIVTDHWRMLPFGKKSAEDVVQQLIASGKIIEDCGSDEVTGKAKIYYKLL